MDALSPSDPINIQYTSGTTGSPKGAVLSHRNILNNGYFVTDLINFSDDRLCIPVPFYHCFGMVMGNLGCTTHGATMVIPAAGSTRRPRWPPSSRNGAPRCTGADDVHRRPRPPGPGRPGRVPATDRDHGGSPCPVEVMKRCIDELNIAEVSIAYGMTETSRCPARPSSTTTLGRRTATVGRAHPHVEIKIVDPDTGAVVPRGEPGEFCTRGYSVMLGYWRDEAKTPEAVDGDGWMHTGDLAVMRDDGYCQIVGRIRTW